MASITIVIPTFNRAQSLTHAIESVKNQTIETWELIIVDDGSTDGTECQVKPYIKDKRIKYFFQENQGVAVARNLGAEKATGSHLVFLDSDDLFSCEFLECLYESNFFNYDLIFWQVRKNVDGKISLWKPMDLGNLYNNIKATFLAGSVCYNKEIFNNSGGYDPKMVYGENYELGLRVSRIPDLKIKYIEKPFLEYKIITGNRTSNSLENRLSSQIYQLRKHENLYQNDRKARAQMRYIIGFTHEQIGDKISAIQSYKKAWSSTPWTIKPLLKIFYLNFCK